MEKEDLKKKEIREMSRRGFEGELQQH